MEQPEPTGETPFKRFQGLTRRLLKVPKAEVQAAEARRKAENASAPRKRTNVRKKP